MRKEGREPLAIRDTFLPLTQDNMVDNMIQKGINTSKGDASHSIGRSLLAYLKNENRWVECLRYE